MPTSLRILCLLALLSTAAAPASAQAVSDPPATAATQIATLPKSDPPPVSQRQRRKAEDAYMAGARHLDRNDPLSAMADFARATTIDPANLDYPRALAMAREHRLTQLVQRAGNERLAGHNAQADALLQQARILDPQNQVVAQHFPPIPPGAIVEDPHQTPNFAGAIQIKPNSGTHSFHLNADVQTILRSVAQTYGIATSFDASLATNTQQIRFELEDVTYAQAMPIALTMAHAFAVPLTANSILIARDGPDTRELLEPLLFETISIPSQNTAELNEIGTLIKNVFEVTHITIAPNASSISLRAPEQTVRAINYTLGDMLSGSSEVMLDMDIYSLDNTTMRNIGVTFPQQLGAYNLYSSAQSAISTNQSIINQAVSSGLLTLNGSATQNFFTELAFLFEAGLLNTSQFSQTIAIIGGGITTTALYTQGATLNLGLNSSDTRALDAIQLRVLDRQDAILRIGTKYPIATAIYSSSVPTLPASIAGATINGTSVSSLLSQFSSAAASIPQFSYEDLGLTLKTTPTIQQSGLVTLKLDFKIESLAGGSLNSVPVLDNQSFTSTITVADGSTALIASNLTQSETDAVAGTPGLSELPGFQSVPNNSMQRETSRLVILITPHIVRHRPNLTASRRIAYTLPASSDAN